VEPDRNRLRTPLPWQREPWERLSSLAKSGGLPHAVLIGGPENIGKSRFAAALAQSLLCDAPTADGACGRCRCCELLAAGSHPDLLEVTVERDSRVIKIDQIRQLIEFAGRTASIARRKAIVLGPAELMNINAANALLKCLEEPTESTSLLLYSHQVQSLPATVRSRCQSLHFQPPPREMALSWLKRYTGSDAVSEQLMDVVGDRPLAARDLHLADALEQRLAPRRAMDELLEGKISPLDFPPLVEKLELPDVLGLIQQRLESDLRAGVLAGRGAAMIDAFRLRDELAHLRRSIANGANPNRQLTIEDSAARLVGAVGQFAGRC